MIIPKEYLEDQIYTHDKTLRDIAKELNSYPSTVSYWVRKHKINFKRKCSKRKQLAGKRFNSFFVIKEVGKSTRGSIQWLCKCDCGNDHIVISNELISGAVRCCGCYHKYRELGEGALRELFANYKANAKTRKLIFGLTIEEFNIITSQNCSYCGVAPSSIKKGYKNRGNYIFNGIDRINNDLGYILENCVSCCTQCNIAKSDYTKNDFQFWIDRVHRHQNSNNNDYVI